MPIRTISASIFLKMYQTFQRYIHIVNIITYQWFGWSFPDSWEGVRIERVAVRREGVGLAGDLRLDRVSEPVVVPVALFAAVLCAVFA